MSPFRTVLLFACPLLGISCKHTEKKNELFVEVVEDGFSGINTDSITVKIDHSLKSLDRLKDESKWLKLRTRVVEARKLATRTKLSELELAKEMAKYGGLNDRLPGESGFIKHSQRGVWNTKLMDKKNTSERTAAIARVLERDLNDFKVQLRTKYQGFDFNSSFNSN